MISMHKFVIPLVGGLMIIAGSILMFLLARKKDKVYQFIPRAYLGTIILQLVCMLVGMEEECSTNQC